MSTPFHDGSVLIQPAPTLSVEEPLAVKGTQPIRPLEDLKADTFFSDEELDEFLAFTAAERHGPVLSGAPLQSVVRRLRRRNSSPPLLRVPDGPGPQALG